uniref:Uncharacterized protein n=1 Tax=Ralstonia solanacearum CFBP2957 TaxID=859656 RepID=D8P637_RALSL|nr:protein of unknown function [Ralstonia solanacearum CFBP2957]
MFQRDGLASEVPGEEYQPSKKETHKQKKEASCQITDDVYVERAFVRAPAHSDVRLGVLWLNANTAFSPSVPAMKKQADGQKINASQYHVCTKGRLRCVLSLHNVN